MIDAIFFVVLLGGAVLGACYIFAELRQASRPYKSKWKVNHCSRMSRCNRTVEALSRSVRRYHRELEPLRTVGSLSISIRNSAGQ
jgi:hypothetical protein